MPFSSGRGRQVGARDSRYFRPRFPIKVANLRTGSRWSRRVLRRRRRVVEWLTLLVCLSIRLCSATALTHDTPDEWRITHIEIRGTARTQDEIVRRELLFHIGDTLSTEQIAETERNLRRLLFLGEVRIHLEPSSVDPDPSKTQTPEARVIIDVAERHARALSPVLNGDADELSYGIVALDYNLLGRGQIAQVTFYHDAISGDEVSATYHEPRLLGTRHSLRVAAGFAGHEGRDIALTLSRPFYALDTRWAHGLSVSHDKQRQRLYQSGALAARYDETWSGASLWLTRSTTHGDWKVRPGVRIGISDRDFAADAPFSYHPSPRRRVVPSLSLTLWKPAYVRERFVLGLGQIEDLQIGSWLTAQAGLSARALGSDRNYPIAAITLTPRGRLGRNGFLFGLLSVSSRFDQGEARHVLTSASGSGYLRLRDVHVLAARMSFHALHRTEDAGSQLLLGVDAGLRGYPPRRFDGTRRILGGLEARPVLWKHSQAVVGAALFVDAGTAWTPGRDRRLWVSSIGTGLRIGLPTVYDAPVLRADIAHGIQADEPWQLSLGLGHSF